MPTNAARREALEARHSALSHRIEIEQGRPGASEHFVRSLKKQRLKVKEEIEGIV